MQQIAGALQTTLTAFEAETEGASENSGMVAPSTGPGCWCAQLHAVYAPRIGKIIKTLMLLWVTHEAFSLIPRELLFHIFSYLPLG